MNDDKDDDDDDADDADDDFLVQQQQGHAFHDHLLPKTPKEVMNITKFVENALTVSSVAPMSVQIECNLLHRTISTNGLVTKPALAK